MDLTPRERRHEKNRQAILQTARELVTEKGADKLSLREIARRIDYSPAALYEYFDSKEDLVGALCTEGFENLTSYLNRVPIDLPPKKRVVELGLTYLEFANQNPELYILIIINLPSGFTALDQLNYETSPYRILLQAMQAGIDSGDFTPREGFGLQEMTYSCWAFVHGIASLGLTQLSEIEVDLDPVNQLALELFLDAL